MILSKEMLIQTTDGMEVLPSETITKPVLLVPTDLYEEIKASLEQ